ncbi:transcriptional regulator FtrA [Rhizobium laguerreae]|uniref:transcriptional regulator FtrA n=1 Tax=Rhizobium laguerreae TaxID=1076926 RepID=UPI001C919C3B|nr:transcriptional regulator FtrA [Rhizobium laguerreae]MBY3342337.1 transcriptional regulator FtrA [Rhizobium laguerreae]MBY3349372.1 transcriptional regulator FtrA [Rhizobium laguerreae]MBY3370475.1 transcriptional regulator FtrA [Rhizobium laguerreae]MBY3425715.1 transcriptional regulator FtrA [Rhizobium laguerreae]MBY3434734.1 transcriptional regulator FtrA [Rhizobium laguerreae]
MTDGVKIMPNSSPPQTKGPLVAALAYDGLCTFEFGIAYEVFGLPRPEMGEGWYRFSVCGIEPGPLRAAGGLTVAVDKGLEVLDEADLIVVPGWRSIDAAVPEPLVSALKAAHERGARIMSLCSGVAVLAGSGLLTNRRATTHWRYVASIAARYPDIALDADVLYMDEGSLLTAAGSAAGIDLCLHVVRGDFGSEVANSVARRLVVPPHREGGQAQFIHAPVPEEREGIRLGPLIEWMRESLSEDQPISLLAKRAGMSMRTFQRRFEATTGLSVGEWLLKERLRHARDLLEKELAVSLDDIAAASGFGTLATMRHHFRRRLGTSPHAYRKSFGG